jgi:hypothetical protein
MDKIDEMNESQDHDREIKEKEVKSIVAAIHKDQDQKQDSKNNYKNKMYFKNSELFNRNYDNNNKDQKFDDDNNEIPYSQKETKKRQDAIDKCHNRLSKNPYIQSTLQYHMALNANNPGMRRTFHRRSFETYNQDADEYFNKPIKGKCHFCGHNFGHPPFHKMVKPDVYMHDYCTHICIKSEIWEEPNFYQNEQLEYLTLMLADLYDYHGPVHTIEKELFEDYGGDLTHEHFLELAFDGFDFSKYRFRSVPFVHQPLFLEEKFKPNDTSLLSLQSKKSKMSDTEDALREIEINKHHRKEKEKK